MGGFCGYSKYNVLKQFPPHLIPRTLVIEQGNNTPQQVSLIKKDFQFPLIVKPDIGERGWKVEKINSEEQLSAYLNKNKGRFLVQEYIDYPLEFGVMYSRLPGKTSGRITSLVQKEFLSVTGDGVSTLAELFNKSERASFHLDMLEVLYKNDLRRILTKNERMELVSIGNHCRGTTFLNANHLITPVLTQVFDQISHQVKGFYFGRYDIRVPSLEDMYLGKNIKILELNGANSEPAHIYDPNMSILKAYRHLFFHWHNLFQISIRNHQKGIPFMPFRKAIDRIRNRKAAYGV